MDRELETGSFEALPRDEARHINKVLRGRDGDYLELVDTDRRLFKAELRGGGREIEVLERLSVPQDMGGVTLYAAVPKGRHMDFVVEKTTELGVGRIVPLVTDHGVVRLNDAGSKIERWRRVAEAAARQSLRLLVPPVSAPMNFRDAAEEAGASGVLLHNVGEISPLEEAIEGAVAGLFVGPEGGWSEEEISAGIEAGSSLAKMGAFRLRSETAGIAAVARTMAALEKADPAIARNRIEEIG